MVSKIKIECMGKHSYNKKDDAMYEIYRRIYESAGGVIELRPYKCKFCKKWHLTSNVK